MDNYLWMEVSSYPAVIVVRSIDSIIPVHSNTQKVVKQVQEKVSYPSRH